MLGWTWRRQGREGGTSPRVEVLAANQSWGLGQRRALLGHLFFALCHQSPVSGRRGGPSGPLGAAAVRLRSVGGRRLPWGLQAEWASGQVPLLPRPLRKGFSPQKSSGRGAMAIPPSACELFQRPFWRQQPSGLRRQEGLRPRDPEVWAGSTETTGTPSSSPGAPGGSFSCSFGMGSGPWVQ